VKRISLLQVCLPLFLISSMLTGCYQDDHATLTPAATAEVRLPRSSPTNIAMLQSPTIQISLPPAQTREPTITPLATLKSEDAYKTITTLIQAQDQCALPCWFGITPGKSNFDDANNYFSQFSEIGHIALSSNKLSLSDWVSLGVNFPTYTLTTQVYRASGGKVAYFTIDAHISKIQNEAPVYGDPAYVEMWHGYFLPEIFAKYGMPGKIFLDTTRLQAESTTNYPFVVWIVYPEQGFLLRYEGVNAKVGNNLRICPLQSDLSIISWRTETSTYERYIKDDMAMGTSLGPQPLEAVTDFDVASFYDRFKNAWSGICFNNPAAFWPPK
jgi:hypothetical protein